MLFESELTKFRCKAGDYVNTRTMAEVVTSFKENLFGLEKDMIAQKPLNKI